MIRLNPISRDWSSLEGGGLTGCALWSAASLPLPGAGSFRLSCGSCLPTLLTHKAGQGLGCCLQPYRVTYSHARARPPRALSRSSAWGRDGEHERLPEGSSRPETGRMQPPAAPGVIRLRGSRRCPAGESRARASRDAAAASSEPAPGRPARSR